MDRPATVEVAKQAGACFGVERALRMVEECAASRACVHTLGPLIHNPGVVNDLAKRGVTVVERVCDAEVPSSLVIRSHGVTPDVIEEALAAGLEVVDATCPFVKRVHREAEKLCEDGYQVVVIGEPGHAEVEGIRARAGEGCIVAASVEDLIDKPVAKRVGVVVQTTQSLARLKEAVAHLVGRTSELKVVNTICEATSRRQAAASSLARTVDVMVVIGGKNSANTRRLYEICSQECSHVYHVERPDELEHAWFVGAGHIGVTAGASTPSSQIDACVEKIRELSAGAEDTLGGR